MVSDNNNKAEKPRGWLRSALAAEERDLTQGPIKPTLILLAIPMVLELAMESVFAVVDMFWIARLGAHAVAAVGLTEAMLTLMYAVCIGFGMAVTAMVARRIGEKKRDAAAITAGQAIWLSGLMSIAIGLVGFRYAGTFLGWMGASPETLAIGSGYTQMMLAGSGSIFYLFVLNAVFRGAGDAALAMRSLWLANGVNLVLDPILIFGWGPAPELGVTGAAIATTIGRSCGVLYQLWHLLRGNGRLRLASSAFRLHLATMIRLLQVSAGGIGQFLIATSSWLFMIRIIASFGANAVAGFTVALRIIEFVILPAWGLGNAAATLVGQNLGAGRVDRARAATWLAARYNLIATLVIAVVLQIFPDVIVSWFTVNTVFSDVAVTSLRYFGIGLPLYALGMIITQAFNGAGDTKTPTWLNLICFWLLQIPLAWTLAMHLEFGIHGILWAMIAAEALLSAAAVVAFTRLRWDRVTL